MLALGQKPGRRPKIENPKTPKNFEKIIQAIPTNFSLLKYFSLFLLPATLLAGKAAGQTTDSAYMQGELKEVNVRSPYAKWKEDSATNRLIYRKRLGEADFRAKVYPESLMVKGVFTKFALKVSGMEKRALKFKTEMERNEQEDFSNIRYNKAVVMRVTGLPDSAAVQFLKAHPMPRAFLVSATELEFLQWIRDRQKGL